MDLARATIDIVKVAANNTEKRWILYTDKDKAVIVKIKSYGQQRIDQEVAVAKAQKIANTAFDKIAANAKEDTKLTELGLIQTEMDK